VPTYKPLNLGLLEEGQFFDNADEVFRSLQIALRNHFDSYSGEMEKGVAKLKLEIDLAWEKKRSMQDGVWSVKVVTKTTHPQLPASIALALPLDDDDGIPALFVQKSGGRPETPRQSRLCTDSGKKIDLETGEIVEEFVDEVNEKGAEV